MCIGMTAATRGAFARRIIGFAGLPFLSLITPFLFLPILARVAGADAWLAFAVGQSSGGFFALIVALGYNTVGPPMVAVSDQDARPILLARSLRARVLVWIPSAVLAAAVAVVIAPSSHRLDAGLMAVAMTMTGLSSAWFMIGLGRASSIAIYEIAPRIVATVAAAIIVVTGGPVLSYPILLIVALIVSVGGYGARTLRARDWAATRWSDFGGVLRTNRAAAATELAGGAYNSLAVTFVGGSATTAQAASYVSGDKLYRDEILAAVATDTGVAFCGYAQPHLLDMDQRPQILVRWHDADLNEEKMPRLETTPGGGKCDAVGYNLEGATIVGASVDVLGQGNNQWIFAVQDALLPKIDYMKRDGQNSGDDRVLALACEYMCAWAGFEEVGGVPMWIAGLRRG